MSETNESGWSGQKYESIFCVFLIGLAVLWRDNPHLAYPETLYLLTLLLLVNLGAGLSLRLWPARELQSAMIILLNCAVITGILHYSGKTASNLWVLYLLPIFTAAILLGGREVVLIASGAVSFNAVFFAVSVPAWSDALIFELAVRSGVFILAAAITRGIVAKDREARGKLRDQRRQLDAAQAMAQVGVISSGVSHDLKTPLTVIMSSAELLKMSLPEDEHSKDIDRIIRAAAHCRSIIIDALSLTGETEFATVPASLNEAAADALSLCRTALFDRGLSVTRDLAPDLPGVRLSPHHMRRLLLNLFTNSGEAMGRGGELTVRTRRVPEAPRDSPVVELLVEDTGPGIPEHLIHRLFEPFVTTRANGQNSGLGLHLCRQIAVRHGGTIRAENREGGGARFILALPADPIGGAGRKKKETVMEES